MQIEVISTGDEVITGFITDTNASWLGQMLLNLGLQARFRHTVSDNLQDIVSLLKERSQQADLIFVNGGLGPTSDDNTARAAAEAAGVGLVRHEEWIRRLVQWHEARNRPMSPTNEKQAYLPEGSELIDNSCGTACGFMLKINRATCFFTPGVPKEFKVMYTDQIEPYLKSHYLEKGSRTLKRLFLFGISESRLQQLLDTISLPATIVFGTRAAYPLLELKLICSGAAESDLTKALTEIRRMVAAYLITEDTYDLPDRINKLCHGGTFAVYDNVTYGELGNEIAGGVNVSTYLATNQPLDQKSRDYIQSAEKDYFLCITKDADRGGAHLSLTTPDGKSHSCYYRLNITLKERTRSAYTLIALAFVYKVLGKEQILHPDDAVTEDLA